jgi:hypothetical protein
MLPQDSLFVDELVLPAFVYEEAPALWQVAMCPDPAPTNQIDLYCYESLSPDTDSASNVE